jgi:hypothetical protein
MVEVEQLQFLEKSGGLHARLISFCEMRHGQIGVNVRQSGLMLSVSVMLRRPEERAMLNTASYYGTHIFRKPNLAFSYRAS